MKRFSPGYVAVLGVGLILMALSFFALQARSTERDDIPSAVCLDCHEGEDAPLALIGTAHDPIAVKTIACVDCHVGEATKMHADDPDEAMPIIPANLPPDSLNAVCTACHENSHALNLYERDPHRDANLACTSCHKIHSHNDNPPLLNGPENTTCLGCHASVRSDFARSVHHPVTEGVVGCRDCHTEIAQSAKQRSAGGPGEVCVQCHGAMQGPFPYEHDAELHYSADNGGCLNCHNPHGSDYPMLLKQTYSSPQFSLCSQCHVVPKHNNNMKHGTRWAGMPCSECHTDIHGSYTSPHLLDASLDLQGCTRAGCHQ